MAEQKSLPLNGDMLLQQLEELAEKLGIAVQYENLTMEESSGRGGICRIKGEYVFIIHARATTKEKIRIIADALRRFDLGDIYVRPVIREFIEGFVDQKE